MPRQIVTAGLHLRVTLEASATGAVAAGLERTIPLDFPIETVIGVWAAASEGGTNLYDSTCSHDGSTILMGTGTVAAETTYYVSYNLEAHLPVIGYPAQNHQGSIMAVTHAMPLKIENVQATDYELADPYGAGDISGSILSSSVACTIEYIKVLTDGTDVDLYLYSGATATRANMEFNHQTINLMWISTNTYSGLKLAFDDGNVYLALVDNNTNATPANTYITLRGHVGI